MGIGLKHCATCREALKSGTKRHSCKKCNYHLCQRCWQHTAPKEPGSGTPVGLSRGAGKGGYVSSDCGMAVPLHVAPHPAPPPVAVVVGGTKPICKWGAACHIKDADHRHGFVHPVRDKESSSEKPNETTEFTAAFACKFGSECYRRNREHLAQFAHPGDRNYRIGMVVFDGNQQPEFQSLWQLFQFHDPEESGHLAKEDFQEAISSCLRMRPDKNPDPLEKAWDDAGGNSIGYVNFRQWAHWAENVFHLDLPLGLEDTGAMERPCRFVMHTSAGSSCSCADFKVADDGSGLCTCGHKTSMHRSAFAERTFSKFLEDATCLPHWEEGEEGLVEVIDTDVLDELQELLNDTHKTEDNWTRDRGCKIHGVNGCAAPCCSKNRTEVPTGYQLRVAFRNQNMDLWQKYSVVKVAITEELRREPHEVSHVESSGRCIEAAAPESELNEWYLFHGTKPETCKAICAANFRLSMAGTGATWKEPGKSTGTPLYGYGIYMAERITKADEYAGEVSQEEEEDLQTGDEESESLYTVLLCRVMGGRTNIVTTNEIQIDRLRADVFDGPFHSVFGDRVSSLGKPYREIVIYDKDQCYPEFLLVYSRNYA